MKGLDSLIRVHKWQVDEVRRNLAELDRLAADLHNRIAQIDDRRIGRKIDKDDRHRIGGLVRHEYPDTSVNRENGQHGEVQKHRADERHARTSLRFCGDPLDSARDRPVKLSERASQRARRRVSNKAPARRMRQSFPPQRRLRLAGRAG